MRLYLAGNNVYSVDDNGKAHATSILAKDKVIETRELESTTLKVDEAVIDLPNEACLITLDELIRKFHISEKNPLVFEGAAKRTRKPKAE